MLVTECFREAVGTALLLCGPYACSPERENGLQINAPPLHETFTG